MVQSISKDGFKIGKGQIKCAEMMNKPEHWRDDEADKIKKGASCELHPPKYIKFGQAF